MVEDRQRVWPTLFTCYEPVARYLECLAAVTNAQPRPRVSMVALDAFLLRQLAAYYPHPFTVIDLAADATLGASAAFWAAPHMPIRRLQIPRPTLEPAEGLDWRAHWPHVAAELGLDVAVAESELVMETSNGWARPDAGLGAMTTTLYVVAVPDGQVTDASERLTALIARQPDALICLLPFGLIGQSPLLSEALECCARTGYVLTACREISPFFASSRMALLYPADNAFVPDVLDRIRQLFDGNFQFLELIKSLVEDKIQTSRLPFSSVDASGPEGAPSDIYAAYEQALRERTHFEEVARSLYNQPLSAEIKHVLIRLTPRPFKTAVKAWQRSRGQKVTRQE